MASRDGAPISLIDRVGVASSNKALMAWPTYRHSDSVQSNDGVDDGSKSRDASGGRGLPSTKQVRKPKGNRLGCCRAADLVCPHALLHADMSKESIWR